ncbi:MAG: histidine kinase N-terminal domain-containing protein [Anaerolineales bacterium]|nr:histidine kinase N-terminal domain-containing protein [Anaerolineales bacterium]MCB9172273.1 histidine kinase N-terminal domain-containing protein [Ardenticatenales bacterium]
MNEPSSHSALIDRVIAGMPLLADLERGDLLLYRQISPTTLQLVAQAAPHSVPPIYAAPLQETTAPVADNPAVAAVIAGRPRAAAPRQLAGHRSPIMQRAYPIRDAGQPVAVLVVEKSLVEHERHAVRRRPFRAALRDLHNMVTEGEGAALAALSPFREVDGILLVDKRGQITYVSSLGSYLFRQLGYSEELIGQSIDRLESADKALVRRAFDHPIPFEEEFMEGERIWIRKVIPIRGPLARLPRRIEHWQPNGFGDAHIRNVMILIHDATAARRKVEEQQVRHAMVQEIHHRVKNNLQTVASLLRIQARRQPEEAGRRALTDATHRILSVAVVHEFLSQHEQRINLRSVAQRIVQQVRDSVIDQQQQIDLAVDGDTIFLPAHQTTMVALVINELLLNALEHGFGEGRSGSIRISCHEEGDDVTLRLVDDGAGLPDTFSLEASNSLGLTIVQTIVTQDLRGDFQLQQGEAGQTEALVRFRKAVEERF